MTPARPIVAPRYKIKVRFKNGSELRYKVEGAHILAARLTEIARRITRSRVPVIEVWVLQINAVAGLRGRVDTASSTTHGTAGLSLVHTCD